MATSTALASSSQGCCNYDIYPFVVQDIEQSVRILGDDDDDEEDLWFLPRTEETKDNFIIRAKIIGEERRLAQEKKKSHSPSPVKKEMKPQISRSRSRSLEVVQDSSSLSAPSSSKTIVRSNKYGMRSLNMGAGHYKKMIRVPNASATCSAVELAFITSPIPSHTTTSSVYAPHQSTAFKSQLACQAAKQGKVALTQEQMSAQLTELFARRYRQLLVSIGAKIDDQVLSDIFQRPVDEDAGEFHSDTVSLTETVVEIDSTPHPPTTAPVPSVDLAVFSPPRLPLSALADRQRRNRHSTNGQCRTCPGCILTAPRASPLAAAAMASLAASASSTPSMSSMVDRPASSRSTVTAPPMDNRCPCCLHSSPTRSYEWSNSLEVCADCAQHYDEFIDDPVAITIKWRCTEYCKKKLSKEPDVQLCQSCHFWLALDAVREIVDQTRPPRPVVQNNAIRVNRRKQTLPSESESNRAHNEKTFVPIYESDYVKMLYDSTGPRLRHVCRTNPSARKARSLSLSFLPPSWCRQLQEEEKLRYADETPVESKRQKWYKRGPKYDRNSLGSGRPMAHKSKKESLLQRRSAGDMYAYAEIAKKRRRHTSGFEEEQESSDLFLKQKGRSNGSKERTSARSKSSSREPSVPPRTSDADERRKSQSQSSPIVESQAPSALDCSDFTERDDVSDVGRAVPLTAPQSSPAEDRSTLPFDPMKDAMRQCTVTISPIERKQEYIRLRQLAEARRATLPDQQLNGGQEVEPNRPPNGFVLVNGHSVDRRLAKSGDALFGKVFRDGQKQSPTGGDSPASSNSVIQPYRQLVLLSNERPLKTTARKTIRSATPQAMSPTSLIAIHAPARPPLSLRLSTERTMDNGAVSANYIEEKLAESAVPKHVQLFSNGSRHCVENDGDAQRVPDHRLDALQL